ncbi:unnamed protein product [Arctogadus glacialis]
MEPRTLTLTHFGERLRCETVDALRSRLREELDAPVPPPVPGAVLPRFSQPAGPPPPGFRIPGPGLEALDMGAGPADRRSPSRLPFEAPSDQAPAAEDEARFRSSPPPCHPAPRWVGPARRLRPRLRHASWDDSPSPTTLRLDTSLWSCAFRPGPYLIPPGPVPLLPPPQTGP